MNLFINGSNREKNCYTILKDIKKEDDELISLSHKDIKYCLGCNSCVKKLDKFCVLDDYVSQNIYKKIIDSNKIIIASPIYMSDITGLLKNVIDRLYPFYHHNYFNNKEVYLILSGQGTYEDNEEEINDIVKYFLGISEWMNFKFTFLDYFCSGNPQDDNNIKTFDNNYEDKINKIKDILN